MLQDFCQDQIINLLHSSWAGENPLGHVGPYMSIYVKPGRLYVMCTRCLEGSHGSEDRDLLIWDIPRCLTLAQTLPKVLRAFPYLDAVYTPPELFWMHFGMTLSWTTLRSSIWKQSSVEASTEWTPYIPDSWWSARDTSWNAVSRQGTVSLRRGQVVSSREIQEMANWRIIQFLSYF